MNITPEIVEQAKVAGKVMVRDSFGKKRYSIKHDSSGYYIRQGKRGTIKIYLESVENIGTEFDLYVFNYGVN